MKTRITLFATFVLISLFANAQTIKWMVKPEYASITHYSNDIFECIDQNGRMQLIDWSGNSIGIAANADAITDYSDGYALVLQGGKILGFLSEDKPHVFQPLNGDYYATKYSFFSEGYVAVAKGGAEGKQGYMDSKGNLVLDCQYLEAMPVRQGWALVVENGKDKVKPRKYMKSGNWSKGMSSLKNGDSFVWASSFNSDGYALVKIKSGKFVVVDVNFNEVERGSKATKEDVNSLDYSYKPIGSKEVSARPNAIPKEDGIRAFEDNGRFGYKDTEGGIMVPCQFGDAGDFYAGRAIVSKGGKFGVVELLAGKFDPQMSDENVRVYPDGMDAVQFTLSVPASLESNKIKMEFDSGDGRYVDCNGLRYDFRLPETLVGKEGKRCTLRAKATYCDDGNDLLLWEGKQEIVVDYISIGISNPTTTTEYADENDNQTVKAVVTNNSDITVTVSAKLSVEGRQVPFKEPLKPKQSKSLTANVKVDGDKQVKASIEVTVDGHKCGSKSSYVSLKKI